MTWTPDQAFWEKIDRAYGGSPGPSEAIKADGSIDYEIGDMLSSFLASEIKDAVEGAENEFQAMDSAVRTMNTVYKEVMGVRAVLHGLRDRTRKARNKRLAEDLRSGVSADIWYDAHDHNDKGAEETIEELQSDIEKAARILEGEA